MYTLYADASLKGTAHQKSKMLLSFTHQTHMTVLFPYNTERDVLQKV